MGREPIAMVWGVPMGHLAWSKAVSITSGGGMGLLPCFAL